MPSFNTKESYLFLSQLADTIAAVLHSNFGEKRFWVVAEIANLKESKGHCYLSLIEKKEGTVDPVSEMRGVIWRNFYGFISEKFHLATGQPLKENIKVLLCAAVNFHVRYGMSLRIEDIEPGFTLGQMLMDKIKVIARLKEKGIFELNKTIQFPAVPQNIAVISAENSLGVEDFREKLLHNPHGYHFNISLFPSMVQGEKAVEDICNSLEAVKNRQHEFDAVVIVRGGGGTADLNCYNDYRLAEAVAIFPVPVVTGIGHTVNSSVVDEVAHTNRITPTDVADFLVETTHLFENRLDDVFEGIAHRVIEYLKNASFGLSSETDRISYVTRQFLSGLNHDLERMGQKVNFLDPVSVLRRGYSITKSEGKIIRSVHGIKEGAMLTSLFSDGEISSKAISG